MLRDLRVAARRFLRDRWSTAAVLVAALGARLNTAVFAFAYGVLLQPLPYRDAEHLWVVDLSVPFDRVDAWRRQLSTFEEIAGYTREGLTVRGPEPRSSRQAATANPLDALRDNQDVNRCKSLFCI
jgi:hypothetical protein